MTIILSDLKQQRSWLTGAVGEGGVARGNLKHTCIAALHDQRDTVCTCQAASDLTLHLAVYPSSLTNVRTLAKETHLTNPHQTYNTICILYTRAGHWIAELPI